MKSLATLLLSAGICLASNNVYVASASAGANDGTSCANAKAYTYFNSSGNWSATPSGIQIGPNTTVHLCGTITVSLNATALTAQGDGSLGSPVTVKFETGASLQSPGADTFIDGNSKAHFVLDGGSTCGWVNAVRVTCNGTIYNTTNGFAGSTCPGGACANQIQTTAIANLGSDWEIKNLEIGPIYIHGGTSDLTWTSPGPRCMGNGTASGYNFHNLIMHDSGWCINVGGDSMVVSNVESYNSDHGVGIGQYSDAAVTVTGLTFHDNYFHDPANWDQTNSAFHHDGIHIFSYCGTNVGGNNTYCPNTIITGVNIYNNRFGGDWGDSNTANVFFEGNVTSSNIFNNVSINPGPSQLNNGFFNGYGSSINVFSNTAIGPGSATQTYKVLGIYNGPGFVIKNNVATDSAPIATNGPWPVGGASGCPYTLPVGAGGGTQNCQNLSYTLATNAYFAPADFSNGFGYTNCTGASCSGNGFLNYSSAGFASFESNAPETGGVFRNSAATSTYFNTTTGIPLTGSPVIGAGTNLSSLCIQNGGALPNALCSDITGASRPLSSAWDIGAFQFDGTSGSSHGGKGSMGGKGSHK